MEYFAISSEAGYTLHRAGVQPASIPPTRSTLSSAHCLQISSQGLGVQGREEILLEGTEPAFRRDDHPTALLSCLRGPGHVSPSASSPATVAHTAPYTSQCMTPLALPFTFRPTHRIRGRAPGRSRASPMASSSPWTLTERRWCRPAGLVLLEEKPKAFCATPAEDEDSGPLLPVLG